MMFSLVDCNNFYVSCERAFNPRLENKPVVVLSNNDGCIISRSNEAKKLGIPMGAPYFKWKKFCSHHHVAVFSSNYELYGDMSQRVMRLLSELDREIEVYSIDEAFLLLDEVRADEMLSLRMKVKTCTGIPISIGMGATKTLAKIANRIAKNHTANGVFVFDRDLEFPLNFPTSKIWGIGHKLAERLKKLNIYTADQLRAADPKMLRLHFSVSLEKTVQELKGISCMGLSQIEPRKQIVSSRSFGKRVTDLNELEEAISCFTSRAALKLRKQNGVTASLYVFLQTNIFSEHQAQYGNGMMYPFPVPTADTRYLIRIAKKGLRHIYKKGYQYHKAGVMLLDIATQHIRQYDMLQAVDIKSERVMTVVDSINQIMGKDTLFVGLKE